MIREQFCGFFFKAKGLNRLFSENRWQTNKQEEENYNYDKDKIMNLENKACKAILLSKVD